MLPLETAVMIKIFTSTILIRNPIAIVGDDWIELVLESSMSIWSTQILKKLWKSQYLGVLRRIWCYLDLYHRHSSKIWEYLIFKNSVLLNLGKFGFDVSYWKLPNIFDKRLLGLIYWKTWKIHEILLISYAFWQNS